MGKSAKSTLKLDVKPRASGVETDVVFVFQDKNGKAVGPRGHYQAVVGRLAKQGLLDGAKKTLHYLILGGKGGRHHVLFAGAGKEADQTEENFRQLGAVTWKRLVSEKAKSAAIHLEGVTNGAFVRAFAEGILLAGYSFTKYRTSKSEEKPGPKEIHFVSEDAEFRKEVARDLVLAQATRDSVFLGRDWSNEPSNIGTPEYFAKEARQIARAHGLKCTILNEAACKREKMNLFLSVGQGSAREGYVVVWEYVPKGVRSPRTVALVGKGITFDSGGISIKPSSRMEDMKHDMSGAATVLGAVLLAARMKVRNRVIAIAAFTENMPGGDATQPGNVITARNGKTVEIINTDAEGRLILADVLDYACDFKPDVIVNAATLTGAVGVALGKQCCAILGNDQRLLGEVKAAAAATGERVWELPLWDEYLEDMKSEVADLRNSANDSNGGTIRGGIFLKQFVRKGVPWVHMDIASMAYGLTKLPYNPPNGATGMYVRTLAEFCSRFDGLKGEK
jgi:leucyl aminopeptidase